MIPGIYDLIQDIQWCHVSLPREKRRGCFGMFEEDDEMWSWKFGLSLSKYRKRKNSWKVITNTSFCSSCSGKMEQNSTEDSCHQLFILFSELCCPSPLGAGLPLHQLSLVHGKYKMDGKHNFNATEIFWLHGNLYSPKHLVMCRLIPMWMGSISPLI